MFVCGFGGDTSLNIPDTFQVNESEIAFHGFSKKKNMDRPLVILADNDKGFKDYLEKRLSECFVVRSFDDGQEALEVICEEYPDLVICDIMLKGMSGEELSSKLKTSRDTSFIPVILMGAHIDVKRRKSVVLLRLISLYVSPLIWRTLKWKYPY